MYLCHHGKPMFVVATMHWHRGCHLGCCNLLKCNKTNHACLGIMANQCSWLLQHIGVMANQCSWLLQRIGIMANQCSWLLQRVGIMANQCSWLLQRIGTVSTPRLDVFGQLICSPQNAHSHKEACYVRTLQAQSHTNHSRDPQGTACDASRHASH